MAKGISSPLEGNPIDNREGFLMLDHSATPDTPYENHRYFLERLKSIL
jgi:hypothetical protein